MTTTFSPTKEQVRALELFATGESLAIEAGAGTGKTSTLKLLAESTTRRGQYIAFNKAIVTESRAKFPRNVACNTAHSLAYKAIVVPSPAFQGRLKGGRMRSMDIARRLGLGPLNIVVGAAGTKVLQPGTLASMVMRAVGSFCQSADLVPSGDHVAYIDGIDLPHPETGQRSYANNNEVRRYLAPFVAKAWADVSSPHGGLPFSHGVYLKLWHLAGPRIDADFILFDEAQDANPVMLAIVAAQTHAQLVFVGDSQQQIYEFTGAVNALAQVPATNRAFLTGSFRFGPAIAAVANVVLGALSAPLKLRGTTAIASSVGEVTNPHAVLTRTNAMAVSTVLEAQRSGQRVHLIGGGTEVVKFARAALDLRSPAEGGRGYTEHPELACFGSWGEVQAYVEQDPQGDELKLLVNLVDEFGAEVIIAALDTSTPEASADLVVSTAHKSKGREWATVRLASDFTRPGKPGEEPPAPSESELRLIYVASTRAQHRLDPSGCRFLVDLLAEAVAS